MNLPNERHEIGKELVEEGDTLSSLGTHSQSTSLSIRFQGSTSPGTLWQLLTNKVGIEHRRTIVGETFAKLNEGDGIHGPLDLSRNTSQCMQLLMGRLITVRGLRLYSLSNGSLADIDGPTGGVGVDAMVLWVNEARLRNGIVVEVDSGRHVGQIRVVCCDPREDLRWGLRRRGNGTRGPEGLGVYNLIRDMVIGS